MGRTVPPPLTPTPARDSKSCRVVRMMIETGQPVELTQLARSSGRCARPRSARRAWRWSRVRWSSSIWAWVGVPEVQGVSSAGLHMPGAAYLAKMASQVAHASGVSCPRMPIIAVGCLVCRRAVRACGRVRCRRVRVRPGRAGTGSRAAASVSSLGPTPVASRARSTSNWAAVVGSTKSGTLFDGLADDLDVFPGDRPGALGGRGGGQHRVQRLPDQGAPRPQGGGLGQSAPGFGGGDAPPGAQHLVPGLGAQLLGGCARPAVGPACGGTGWAVGRPGSAARRPGPAVRQGSGCSGRWRPVASCSAHQRVPRSPSSPTMIRTYIRPPTSPAAACDL